MRCAPKPLGVAVIASVLLASGCSSPPSTDLPEGLTLSIYQNRTDVAARKLEVSFLNNTGEALVVTRLEVWAEQFVAPAIWPKTSTTIPSGVTISLPVSLTEPDCDAVPTDAVVEFDYRLGDGRSGTAVGSALDRLQRLEGIRTEDCIAVSVASVATIRADTVPRRDTVSGKAVAAVDLTVTPTGSEGSVTLGDYSSTTLLSPLSPEGVLTGEGANAAKITGTDAPSTITLMFTPNRCDSHAIAEDKRGTIFPIAATTSDGFAGRLYIPAADSVRDALYEFVRTACGLPTG